MTANAYKYLGLTIALVLPILLGFFQPALHPNPMINALLKEAMLWSLFVVLLLVAKYGEQDPVRFTTNTGFLKTLGMALLILISMIAAGIFYRILYHMMTKTPVPAEALLQKVYGYPAWLKLLLSISAGVIEETFFRAYAISRILQLTGNRYLAFIVPLLFFALAHYGYGTFNHVAGAFVLGLILTIWYIKKRNLAANIIAHGTLDSLALLFQTA